MKIKLICYNFYIIIKLRCNIKNYYTTIKFISDNDLRKRELRKNYIKFALKII